MVDGFFASIHIAFQASFEYSSYSFLRDIQFSCTSGCINNELVVDLACSLYRPITTKSRFDFWFCPGSLAFEVDLVELVFAVPRDPIGNGPYTTPRLNYIHL